MWIRTDLDAAMVATGSASEPTAQPLGELEAETLNAGRALNPCRRAAWIHVLFRRCHAEDWKASFNYHIME
jgi:hypothetical protein